MTDGSTDAGDDELARAAFSRGDYPLALTLAQAWLQREPRCVEALLLCGNAAIALHETDLGIEVLTRLHHERPELVPVIHALAELHNQQGAALRRQRQEGLAARQFERALALHPRHPLAGLNLALCLHAQERVHDAGLQLQAHLQRHPNDADARLLQIEWSPHPGNEAETLQQLLLQPEAARWSPRRIAHVTAAAGLYPQMQAALMQLPATARVRAAIALAESLCNRGEVEPARAVASTGFDASDAGRHSPGLRAGLASALALAPMMHSPHAIDADRQRIGRELERLATQWTAPFLERCEPALEQLAWSNFHLAYHGCNDRALQLRFAALLERAAACFAPALAARPAAGSGRRVGLLSSSWRECTAGAYFSGWIDWLRAAGFEVYLYQLGPRRDATTERLAARAHHFRFLEGALLPLAQQVRDDGLDLLLYPELGMDTRLMPLAALRLARRQAAAWGHPVSSGFSTLDAWFSCAMMEPTDAQTHYVEPLRLLPGLGVEYTRPSIPPATTRTALGLPQAVPLILVPQSLFKLHPDNDAVIAALAARLPTARFVLFEGEHPAWREQLNARIAPAFAALGLNADQHLHWITPGSRERYLQINQACDIMLDSLHWSGGNTSLDALSCGLPVLTCPGESMRSRQSLAMLGLLSLQTGLVCGSPAQLVSVAVDILTQDSLRASLRERIMARLDDLFCPDAARSAFLQHVTQLCSDG